MKVQDQEKLLAASREEVTGLRQKLQQACTSVTSDRIELLPSECISVHFYGSTKLDIHHSREH